MPQGLWFIYTSSTWSKVDTLSFNCDTWWVPARYHNNIKKDNSGKFKMIIIIRFWHLVSVGSQKYRRVLFKKIYYAIYNPIWLYLCLDDHQFGYITKLWKKTLDGKPSMWSLDSKWMTFYTFETHRGFLCLKVITETRGSRMKKERSQKKNPSKITINLFWNIN
jgi:hypothetical protein